MVGSERMAAPRIHTGGLGESPANASSQITIAQAPSDEGQLSRKRIGSHSMGDASTSCIVISGICRCDSGLRAPCSLSLTATLIPVSQGAAERRIYSRMIGAK